MTWNSQILECQKEIESAIGVTPMRPTDLIVEIEQIRNSASYQPVRLRGSTLQIQKVERHRRNKLEGIFVNSDLGETKVAFRQRLSAVSEIHPEVDCRVVINDGEPVALFSLDGTKMNVLEIPLLRLREGRLARTLAREIATTAIESSMVNNSSITAITDEWLEPYVEEALAESGFVKSGAHWLKLNYAALGTENGRFRWAKTAISATSGLRSRATKAPTVAISSRIPNDGIRDSPCRKTPTPAKTYE